VQFLRDENNLTLLQQVRAEGTRKYVSTRRLLRVTPFYFLSCFLFPTSYSPLTTYYLLPTTYHLLPTTYYLLPTIYHLLLTYVLLLLTGAEGGRPPAPHRVQGAGTLSRPELAAVAPGAPSPAV
jgi:hypothetical protein